MHLPETIMMQQPTSRAQPTRSSGRRSSTWTRTPAQHTRSSACWAPSASPPWPTSSSRLPPDPWRSCPAEYSRLACLAVDKFVVSVGVAPEDPPPAAAPTGTRTAQDAQHACGTPPPAADPPPAGERPDRARSGVTPARTRAKAAASAAAEAARAVTDAAEARPRKLPLCNGWQT